MHIYSRNTPLNCKILNKYKLSNKNLTEGLTDFLQTNIIYQHIL